MNDKQQDVALILKLFELRRDDLLRRARRWFFTEFNPQGAGEIAQLLVAGHDQSAYFRMITSYWDMAASFVNNGGIDEKMFLDANGEHVAVFCKLEPFIEELRATIRRPDYLRHLETLANKSPDAKERLHRMRGLFKQWTEAHQNS